MPSDPETSPVTALGVDGRWYRICDRCGDELPVDEGFAPASPRCKQCVARGFDERTRDPGRCDECGTELVGGRGGSIHWEQTPRGKWAPGARCKNCVRPEQRQRAAVARHRYDPDTADRLARAAARRQARQERLRPP